MSSVDNAPADEVSDIDPVVKSTTFGWILVVCAVLGLLASLELTIERIKVLDDPNYTPGCDINALISCGSLMDTPAAEIFGFPNSLLGLASFGAILGAGGALAAGAQIVKRYFWAALVAGVSGGLAISLWLMYMSMFEFHVLCPWCAVTWVATITAFAYTVMYVLTTPSLGASQSLQRKASGVAAYHPVIVGGVLLLVAAGVIIEVIMYS